MALAHLPKKASGNHAAAMSFCYTREHLTIICFKDIIKMAR